MSLTKYLCFLNISTMYLINENVYYMKQESCSQERQPLYISYLLIIHGVGFADPVQRVLAQAPRLLEECMGGECPINVPLDYTLHRRFL